MSTNNKTSPMSHNIILLQHILDVSTPPSLDLACPQAITELGKPVHKFEEWSVDK